MAYTWTVFLFRFYYLNTVHALLLPGTCCTRFYLI